MNGEVMTFRVAGLGTYRIYANADRSEMRVCAYVPRKGWISGNTPSSEYLLERGTLLGVRPLDPADGLPNA